MPLARRRTCQLQHLVWYPASDRRGLVASKWIFRPKNDPARLWGTRGDGPQDAATSRHRGNPAVHSQQRGREAGQRLSSASRRRRQGQEERPAETGVDRELRIGVSDRVRVNGEARMSVRQGDDLPVLTLQENVVQFIGIGAQRREGPDPLSRLEGGSKRLLVE